jgi:hypothetical protein
MAMYRKGWFTSIIIGKAAELLHLMLSPETFGSERG